MCVACRYLNLNMHDRVRGKWSKHKLLLNLMPSNPSQMVCVCVCVFEGEFIQPHSSIIHWIMKHFRSKFSSKIEIYRNHEMTNRSTITTVYCYFESFQSIENWFIPKRQKSIRIQFVSNSFDDRTYQLYNANQFSKFVGLIKMWRASIKIHKHSVLLKINLQISYSKAKFVGKNEFIWDSLFIVINQLPIWQLNTNEYLFEQQCMSSTCEETESR